MSSNISPPKKMRAADRVRGKGHVPLKRSSACNHATKIGRYWVDNGVGRALKTQPLSTRPHPPIWPCSGSSPVVPRRVFQSLPPSRRGWWLSPSSEAAAPWGFYRGYGAAGGNWQRCGWQVRCLTSTPTPGTPAPGSRSEFETCPRRGADLEIAKILRFLYGRRFLSGSQTLSCQ